MTITPSQAAAVAARRPYEVTADGATLYDRESGAHYEPPSLRHALGWIAAGDADSAGENPRTTRLAEWWFHH